MKRISVQLSIFNATHVSMRGTSLSALRTDLISAEDSSKVNSSEYGLGGADASLSLLFCVTDGTTTAMSMTLPATTHAPILRRLLSAQN